MQAYTGGWWCVNVHARPRRVQTGTRCGPCHDRTRPPHSPPSHRQQGSPSSPEPPAHQHHALCCGRPFIRVRLANDGAPHLQLVLRRRALCGLLDAVRRRRDGRIQALDHHYQHRACCECGVGERPIPIPAPPVLEHTSSDRGVVWGSSGCRLPGDGGVPTDDKHAFGVARQLWRFGEAGTSLRLLAPTWVGVDAGCCGSIAPLALFTVRAANPALWSLCRPTPDTRCT